MNNNGKSYGIGTIAVIAVLAIVAGYFLFIGGLPTIPFALAPTGPVTPAKQALTCNSTTSPELKLVVLDSINEGTLRTTAFDSNVYLNGAYSGGYHLVDDATVDVSPGDGYSVWFKESGANTTYFGFNVAGNVSLP